jgi:nucleotide-binding universal stress UspA family protein
VEELAINCKSRVVLMTVQEESLMLLHDEVIDSERYLRERSTLLEKSSAYLENQQTIMKKKGISVVTRIKSGPVVRSIVDLAMAEEADLIALASHGWGGLRRTFYGSVASGIINRTDRPLLLIRSQRKD